MYEALAQIDLYWRTKEYLLISNEKYLMIQHLSSTSHCNGLFGKLTFISSPECQHFIIKQLRQQQDKWTTQRVDYPNGVSLAQIWPKKWKRKKGMKLSNPQKTDCTITCVKIPKQNSYYTVVYLINVPNSTLKTHHLTSDKKACCI